MNVWIAMMKRKWWIIWRMNKTTSIECSCVRMPPYSFIQMRMSTSIRKAWPYLRKHCCVRTTWKMNITQEIITHRSNFLWCGLYRIWRRIVHKSDSHYGTWMMMAIWAQIWKSMKMRWFWSWRLSLWTRFAWSTTKFWKKHTSMIRDLVQYTVILIWAAWLKRQFLLQVLPLIIHSKNKNQVFLYEIRSATSLKKSKEIKTSTIKWFSSEKYLMTTSKSEPFGNKRQAQISTQQFSTSTKKAHILSNFKPKSQLSRANRTFSVEEMSPYNPNSIWAPLILKIMVTCTSPTKRQRTRIKR